MRATWRNGCAGLIWESLLQLKQSSREARACVTEPPSQRQVFRLIHAKQNRQKAEANNNNTSTSCGRQPGNSHNADRLLEWQRLCLKFYGENYVEDQCWAFRVRINISFKSFILLSMIWSCKKKWWGLWRCLLQHSSDKAHVVSWVQQSRNEPRKS